MQVHEAAQVNDAAAAQVMDGAAARALAEAEQALAAAEKEIAASAWKRGTGATLWPRVRRYAVVRRRVYLSGPISGYDYEERRMTFARWAETLRDVGFEPLNPMENGVPKEAASEVHMRADLKMLLECDSIMMLNGWKRSLGARVEHEVALSCGLSVMNESELALRDIYWFE